MNRSMSIFCDGACRGNGQRGAVGGWAWAYWNGVARGEPVVWAAQKLATPPGQPATNQRAELTALLEALQWWRDVGGGGGAITIYTDSQYAINCTSKWGPSWRRAGWKRPGGDPLQNLDLIVPLVEIWKPKWKLQHVRGHQVGNTPEVWGNNWVDQAAVGGSQGVGRVASTNIVVTPADDGADTGPVVFFPASSDTGTITHIPPEIPVIITSAPPKKATPTAHLRQTDIRNWFL